MTTFNGWQVLSFSRTVLDLLLLTVVGQLYTALSWVESWDMLRLFAEANKKYSANSVQKSAFVIRERPKVMIIKFKTVPDTRRSIMLRHLLQTRTCIWIQWLQVSIYSCSLPKVYGLCTIEVRAIWLVISQFDWYCSILHYIEVFQAWPTEKKTSFWYPCTCPHRCVCSYEVFGNHGWGCSYFCKILRLKIRLEERRLSKHLA